MISTLDTQSKDPEQGQAVPDQTTLAAYESGAEHYAEHRSARNPARARRFKLARPPGRCLDLGCGPGLWFPYLGRPLFAADASAAMCTLAQRVDPGVPITRAALEALPFAKGSFTGIWVNKCLQHVAAPHVPMGLADLHRILTVGGRLAIEMFAGSGTFRSDDDLPGRHFTLWDPEEFADVCVGAGFGVDDLATSPPGDGYSRFQIAATRLRTLPDTVGPHLRLLICGLNPSLVAADAGVGFAGPTNRFWKALAAAGLSDVNRDARALFVRDRIGMTDQVKRATRAASELDRGDYREGLERLRRVVARTQPAAVCIVGLAGWRAAVDRRAQPGWQDPTPLSAPTYVMPSTSGLNARTSLAELSDHLRSAVAPP